MHSPLIIKSKSFALEVIKKEFCFLCLFLFILSLTSCMRDPYADKRPVDYGDAVWVSENPEIYFTVDTSSEEHYYPIGYVLVDGKQYLCDFSFVHQTNRLIIYIFDGDTVVPNGWIGQIDGNCDFSPDSFVMHIEGDTVFAGKYESITFYKNDSPNT